METNTTNNCESITKLQWNLEKLKKLEVDVNDYIKWFETAAEVVTQYIHKT